MSKEELLYNTSIFRLRKMFFFYGRISNLVVKKRRNQKKIKEKKQSLIREFLNKKTANYRTERSAQNLVQKNN